MPYKYNGGFGALICEKCRVIIEGCISAENSSFKYTGPVEGKQVYMTNKAGRRIHYCSQYCCYKHNANYRKEVDTAVGKIIQLFT